MPRLDKLLARNLGVPRRLIGRVIRRGAVESLDGRAMKDPRMPVDVGERVRVDGEELVLREHAHLMLHKPHGVVTARADDRHPTAYALLEGAPLFAELRAVGRLDLDAVGLLLWTTDGQRVHALTHPRRAVPRTYHVALAAPFDAPPRDDDGAVALELRDGLRPRVVELGALDEAEAHPALLTPLGTEALATVTLLDGAYHEVKRIFAALGSHVLCLARVRHGPVELPRTLEAGAWQLLDAL